MDSRHWPDRDSSERKRDRADKRRSVGNRLRLARDEAFLPFVSPAQKSLGISEAEQYGFAIQPWFFASFACKINQLQF
jgi:hypothetical protein